MVTGEGVSIDPATGLTILLAALERGVTVTLQARDVAGFPAAPTSLVMTLRRADPAPEPSPGAPVAVSGPKQLVFAEMSGRQTISIRDSFSVEGDGDLTSVSWTLSGASGAAFVSIDAPGVLTVDTDASGAVEALELTVRATNARGFAELGVTVSVEAPGAPFVNAVVGGRAAWTGRAPVANSAAGELATWSAT